MIDTHPEGELPSSGTQANVVLWLDEPGAFESEEDYVENSTFYVLRGPEWARYAEAIANPVSLRNGGLFLAKVELVYEIDYNDGEFYDIGLIVLDARPIPIPTVQQLTKHEYEEFKA